jgi:hypothetical protein
MIKHDMYAHIIKYQLPILMNQELRQTQLRKLRDLFIGMVLNLTCNIEDSTIITYLVKDMNILKPLLQILQDKR